MAKGYENLIPNNLRSKEEVRAHSRKGGIRSGETRRAQRTFREITKQLLQCTIADPEEIAKAGVILPNVDPKDFTAKMSVVLAMIKEARKGNVNAGKLVQEMAGEVDPVANITINQNDPKDIKKAVKEVKDLLKDL